MTTFSQLAKASAFALISITALSASAQSTAPKMYGEIGYTMLSYKEDGYKADPGVLRAIIGTEVHPNVNIEGMVGFGIKDGTTKVGSTTVTSQVDSVWGLYVKPKAMISSDVEIFGRVGYASSKVSASIPGASASDSGGSLSYGVGLNFAVAANTSINADYMSYYSKNGVKATGFTVGVGFKF